MVKYLPLAFLLFSFLPSCAFAQAAAAPSDGAKEAPVKVINNMPGSTLIPKEQYDASVILPVPSSNSNASQVEKHPSGDTIDNAVIDNDAIIPPNEPTDLSPVETAPIEEGDEADKNQGFRLVTSQKDADYSEIPKGTLAVFIDVEEAFNKNPWTLQARKNMRLDLEEKQVEFVKLKDQLAELKTSETNLIKDIAYYKPFYQNLEYIAPAGGSSYPKIPSNALANLLNTTCFSSSASIIDSPVNTPQKMSEIKKELRDTRQAITEREAFLLNYQELTREEVLSRQDYIVQQIIKEIYSGIKEFAATRNIALVVDRQDLIYGKPLNVTNEFIKWMKSYHKKYLKEHGDIL
ncbi:MAG: OmpH family outer membrane protein [Elusimicrobiota bacterium]|jgi:Skp family chaperone for outer membrane proteins|nr:OmpH family outer membrane protein [Elusimicrobiota bacterium]